MRIQILELGVSDLGQLQIQLTIGDQQPLEMTIVNPHISRVKDNLEWYFEGYMYEPYIADTKVEKSKKIIFDYGIDLFNQLFRTPETKAQYQEIFELETVVENIYFEIVSKNNGGLIFQSIIWESLRDPDIVDKPLIARGIRFYRTSLTKPKLLAKTKIDTVINLLIVTARPAEENDADYRTIQRPIMNILRENSSLKVRPYILRPGTYKALKEHLTEKESGFYHIIHFDMHGAVMEYAELEAQKKADILKYSYQSFGKNIQSFQVRFDRTDIEPYKGSRAFLFFETGTQGLAEPTLAKEMGQLLRDFRIPVCLLNACQSAKQDGIDHDTNLGKIIFEEGIELVLAMRYAVSIRAATILMERIYTYFFHDNSIDKAISLGRKRLAEDKNRNAILGQSIELEDWLLPVLYKRNETSFTLKEESKEERKLRNVREKSLARYPFDPPYGFIGRDLDIWKIEKLLMNHHHLLLKGMIGVGKTTLLKYLAWWWRATQFRNVKNCIYFGVTEKFNYLSFLQKIAKEILLQEEILLTDLNDWELLEIDVLAKIGREPYALLIDHVFEFSDERAIDFFTRVGKLSFIVYSSVNKELTLAPKTFKTNTYFLDGLDKEASYEFAKKVLATNTNKTIEYFTENDAIKFERLLKMLMGFPSAMEVILPKLQSMSIDELLQSIQNGTIEL